MTKYHGTLSDEAHFFLSFLLNVDFIEVEFYCSIHSNIQLSPLHNFPSLVSIQQQTNNGSFGMSQNPFPFLEYSYIYVRFCKGLAILIGAVGSHSHLAILLDALTASLVRDLSAVYVEYSPIHLMAISPSLFWLGTRTT